MKASNVQKAMGDRKAEGILLIAIGAFICVKLYAALSPYAAPWDEAVYIGMGKYLYTLGSSGLWEIIRPVGLPILLGLMWAIKLPVFFWEATLIGFSAGSIILTYLIGKKLFGKESGLFAALFLLSSTIFFREAGKLMTEIPSTFFALAFLYALINRRVAYASLLAGLAAMLKFPHLMLAGILLVYVAAEYLRNRKIGTSIRTTPYFLVIGMFLLASYLFYRESPFDFLAALKPFILASPHQSNPVDTVSGTLYNAFYYVITAVRQNAFAVFAVSGIYYVLKKKMQQAYPALAYLALYLAYFTTIINKQGRFILLFLPVIALFTGFGVYRLLLTGKGTSKTGTAITIALVLTAAAVSFSFLSGDYQAVHDRMHSERPSEFSNVTGVVLTSDPRVAYYTDAKIIPYYFSTADGREGIRMAAARYAQYKNNSAVIYHSRDFYCTEKDTYCREQLSIISAQE